MEAVNWPLALAHYTPRRLLQAREGQRTWWATDAEGQHVVIKALALTEVRTWETVNLFEREIKTLRQLNHPRIPRLLATHRETDALYLVQEAIPGESLRQRLEQTGPLTEEEARALATDLLEILSYLQTLNPTVIHRDIKPENIMLHTGKAYLIDFGAVRDTALNQLTVAGTFGYMAPEQAAGQVTPASDLYALGVTLIESLSGKAPYVLTRDEALRLHYTTEAPLSPALRTWLDALTHPDARERPTSAEEAQHWLTLKAPPEQLGRIEKRTLSEGERELIIHPPTATDLSWGKLARETLLKAAACWFVALIPLMYFTVGMFNILPEFLARFIAVLRPQVFSFFALWYWLIIRERAARSAEKNQPQRMLICNQFLYYNNQAYPLENLISVNFGGYQHLSLAPPTRTTLHFKKKVAKVPIALTPEEQQFLLETLERPQN